MQLREISVFFNSISRTLTNQFEYTLQVKWTLLSIRREGYTPNLTEI